MSNVQYTTASLLYSKAKDINTLLMFTVQTVAHMYHILEPPVQLICGISLKIDQSVMVRLTNPVVRKNTAVQVPQNISAFKPNESYQILDQNMQISFPFQTNLLIFQVKKKG